MSADISRSHVIPSRVSLIPVVAAGIALFWIWHAVNLYASARISESQVTALFVWFAALTVWGVFVSWLSLSGRTRSSGFLRAAPGLWIPPLAVFMTAATLALWPSLRSAFLAIANDVSQDQFMWVQTLRIAAIGGVTKTVLGRLPPAFGFGTGIPDLAFGLSAAVLLTTGAWSQLPPNLLIAWNIFGAAVFMAAPVVLQLTLPGPFQLFTKLPDGRELLDFPMILAPFLLGPLLLIGNALHIVKLMS